MKKFRLQKLVFHNFKGIRDLAINVDGENLYIYGDNAEGKTSIADGFFWLLFNKDSLGRTQFDLKTEGLTGVINSVEGTFTLDGEEIVLKKEYYEKWVKERGSAEKTFKGHTTDYFINSVPVKMRDYEERIADIIEEDSFKLLTNPLHFNEGLTWQEQRELLIEVCGDIEDKDIVASNKSLKGLEKVLKKHSIDDYTAMNKAKLRDLNKQLDKLPVRIDEVSLSLPKEIDFDAIRDSIKEVNKENDQLRKKISNLSTTGEADIKRQIAELETKKASIQIKFIQEEQEEIQKKLRNVQGLVEQSDEIADEIRNINGEIKDIERKIASDEAEMSELRDKGKKALANQFKPPMQETTCYACGQEIPSWKLEEAKNKAKAKFNQEKASEVKKVNKRGKELKVNVESLNEKLAEKKEVLDEAQKRLEPIEKLYKKRNAEYKEISTRNIKFIDSEDYQHISNDIELLKKKLDKLSEGSKEEEDKLNNLISSNEQNIDLLKENLAKEGQLKKGNERLEELKQEEKRLAKEYSKIEKQVLLSEEFMKKKVELLDNKINNRFSNLKFKLFNEQVKGGLVPTCEALINTNGHWVPYSSANDGGKINAGIQIINTLSEHYGFSGVIFIDNRESVTKINPTDHQMINLVVVEGKKLTIQKESEKLSKQKENEEDK